MSAGQRLHAVIPRAESYATRGNFAVLSVRQSVRLRMLRPTTNKSYRLHTHNEGIFIYESISLIKTDGFEVKHTLVFPSLCRHSTFHYHLSGLGEIIVGKHDGGAVECPRLKILFPTESAGFGVQFFTLQPWTVNTEFANHNLRL